MNLRGNANNYNEEHMNKSIELANKQYKDGWSLEEIRDYFYALDCSILCVQQIIKGIDQTNKVHKHDCGTAINSRHPCTC